MGTARSRHTGAKKGFSVVITILMALAIGLEIIGISPAGATVPSGTNSPSVRLANSIIPAVANGQIRPVLVPNSTSHQLMTLTITLNRSNQVGFEAYLNAVEDHSSPLYRHFMTQSQLTAVFGPTQTAYDSVRSWLLSQGFSHLEGSSNRLTITFSGSRAKVERSFRVAIVNYRAGSRVVYANESAPAVPPRLASDIADVGGLSDLDQPTAPSTHLNRSTPSLSSLPQIDWTAVACGLAANKITPVSDLVGALLSAFYATVESLQKIAAVSPFVEGFLAMVCTGMLTALGASLATCNVMSWSNPNIWQQNPQCAAFAKAGFAPKAQSAKLNDSMHLLAAQEQSQKIRSSRVRHFQAKRRIKLVDRYRGNISLQSAQRGAGQWRRFDSRLRGVGGIARY